MIWTHEFQSSIVASEDQAKAIFALMSAVNGIETRLTQGMSNIITNNPIIANISARVANVKAALLAAAGLLHDRITIEAVCISCLKSGRVQVPLIMGIPPSPLNSQ
eukprot:scaffold148708_cov37-Attheya_sp.AAC.2